MSNSLIVKFKIDINIIIIVYLFKNMYDMIIWL